MRRNPGRFGWLWGLLLAVALPLWAASVEVHLDKKEVLKGDTVTFSITAHGDDVAFPVVKEIGGFLILGTAQRSNIAIVNGRVEKSFTKSYTFAPMKSVTIPPLIVTVDGRRYTTRELKVEVVDAHTSPAQGGGQGPRLTLELERTDLKVGEPVELKVVLRYPATERYAQVEIQKPEFPNFWIKQLGEATKRMEGDEVVETRRYLLFPQKPGDFTLGPLTARVAKRVRVKPPIDDPFFDDDFFNGFFARLQWRRIASNRLEAHVAPLPGGVSLYGDFTIRVEADKRKVAAGKPVRFTIEVEGEGNVEDIGKFEPDIPGAVVYADEPAIKEWVKNGRYGGSFTQVVTVVSDGNFTFPSLTLRYYDPKADKVVEKRTAPIFVEVTGGAVGQSAARGAATPGDTAAAETQTQGEERKTAAPGGEESASLPLWAALALLALGGALGAWGAVAYGRWRSRKRGRKETPAAKRILRARNDRELFELLLPYAHDDPEIAKALRRLEANLYHGANHKVDRELLAEIVEELEEERA
ncbi:BatD family protein [Hydrogenimonas sp.]